jgi:hypothetical protein
LALYRLGRDLGDVAFWSAVDLGNLGGRAAENIRHPNEVDARGRPRRVPGPVPEPESTAIALLRAEPWGPALRKTAVFRAVRNHFGKSDRRIGLRLAVGDVVALGAGIPVHTAAAAPLGAAEILGLANSECFVRLEEQARDEMVAVLLDQIIRDDADAMKRLRDA